MASRFDLSKASRSRLRLSSSSHIFSIKSSPFAAAVLASSSSALQKRIEWNNLRGKARIRYLLASCFCGCFRAFPSKPTGMIGRGRICSPGTGSERDDADARRKIKHAMFSPSVRISLLSHMLEDAVIVASASLDAVMMRSMAPSTYLPILSSLAAWMNAETLIWKKSKEKLAPSIDALMGVCVCLCLSTSCCKSRTSILSRQTWTARRSAITDFRCRAMLLASVPLNTKSHARVECF